MSVEDFLRDEIDEAGEADKSEGIIDLSDSEAEERVNRRRRSHMRPSSADAEDAPAEVKPVVAESADVNPLTNPWEINPWAVDDPIVMFSDKDKLSKSLDDKSAFAAHLRNTLSFNTLAETQKKFVFDYEDSDFNLAEQLRHSGIPENYISAYGWCRNQEAFDFQSKLIMSREEDKRVLSETGWFKGMLLKGLMDFTVDTWYTVPFFFGATAVSKAALPHIKRAFPSLFPAVGNIPKEEIGKHLLKAAGVAGIGYFEGGLFSGSEEAVKKISNSSITWEDVAEKADRGAIAGALFFGIGSAGQLAFSQSRRLKVVDAFFNRRALDWELGKINFKLSKMNLNYQGNYRAEQLPALYEYFYRWSPLGQCATSEFDTVNKMGFMFLRSDYATAYARGGGEAFPSVSALTELNNNKLLLLKGDYLNIKNKYSQSEFAEANKVDFEEAVKRCIWNNGKHESQEVVEAATLLNNYKNKLMREAHEHGVFDGVFSDEVTQTYLTKDEALLSREDLLAKLMKGDTDRQAVWYFPRVYDKRAIIKDSDEFMELLKKGKIKEYALKGLEMPTEESLKKSAEGTYNTIIGFNKNSKYISSVPRSGSDKSRTVLIHDEVLESYLEKDPLKIIEALHRELSPEIQINKTLKAYGMKSLDEFETSLSAEYHKILATLTDEEAKLKVTAKRNDALKLTRALPELIRGAYGGDWSQLSPTLTTWIDSGLQLVYAARMGGVLISSLPDLAHLHLEYGGLAPIGKGIVYFAKNVSNGMVEAAKGVMNFAAGREVFKKGLTKHEKAVGRELHIMGVAMDTAAAKIRARLGMEMPQPDNINVDWFSKIVNRGMHVIADGGTRLTGIHHWDDALRSIVAQLHSHELLGVCKASLSRELTKEELYFLSENRIPISSAKEIGKRFETHGGEFEKMRVANSHEWIDDVVTEQYQASVLAKSRNLMPMPGAGDTPLWAHNNLLGKLLLQFKSYGFKHYSEIIKRFVSEEHPRFRRFTGFMLSCSLNYLSTMFKSHNADDPYDWDDPKLLSDSVAKNFYMLDALLRMRESWEYKTERYGAGIGTLATFGDLFPVIGYAEQGLDAIGDVLKEKPMSQNEIKRAWNLWPWLTLPQLEYLKSRKIKDYVEKSGGKLTKSKHDRRIERQANI